jgi:hypothetical protein
LEKPTKARAALRLKKAEPEVSKTGIDEVEPESEQGRPEEQPWPDGGGDALLRRVILRRPARRPDEVEEPC